MKEKAKILPQRNFQKRGIQLKVKQSVEGLYLQKKYIITLYVRKYVYLSCEIKKSGKNCVKMCF